VNLGKSTLLSFNTYLTYLIITWHTDERHYAEWIYDGHHFGGCIGWRQGQTFSILLSLGFISMQMTIQTKNRNIYNNPVPDINIISITRLVSA
jgi:hypothetical protein